MVWFSKFTSNWQLEFDSTAENSWIKKDSDTWTGKSPLFKAFPLKISAKKLETITLNPKPTSAQAACSRLEPQPKLSPAIKIVPEYIALLRGKFETGFPVLSKRQSLKTLSPKPFLSVAFKKRAGIIWSVSTFAIFNGIAWDMKVLNFSIN